MKALLAFIMLAMVAAVALADGRLPIEMDWAEAEKYLKSRGFDVRPGSGDPNSLRTTNAVDGLTFSFGYQAVGTSSPPKCIAVMGGIEPIDWKAQLTLMTGVPEAKIPKTSGKTKKGKVKVGMRTVPFLVETNDAGILIGNCE